MARMRVVQVAAPGAPFELVERELPSPGNGEVRIRVEACGICHSDSFTKEGSFPGIRYPIVPGHEVAGRIDAVGPHSWDRTVTLLHLGALCARVKPSEAR